jgi:predicted DNA-binding ribbon-helix-helix protein
MRDTENTMNTTKAQVSLDVEEATYRKLSLMAEEQDLTIPKLLERLLLELADSN